MSKSKITIFASYNQLDEILEQYDSSKIYTIMNPPRKIIRRLENAPFIEMIALPPYVKAANAGLQEREEILFTLGYFTSLATVDFDLLINILNGGIIISAENNDEYGVRMILAGLLHKLGVNVYYYTSGGNNVPLIHDECFKDLLSNSSKSNSFKSGSSKNIYNESTFNESNNINVPQMTVLMKYISDLPLGEAFIQKSVKNSSENNIKCWGDECLFHLVSRLQLLFPQVNMEDDILGILEKIGLLKFIIDNINYIGLINQGHYLPSIFGEKKEDMTLSLSERLGRILLSRQAVTSQFVKTIIELSSDIVRKHYVEQSKSIIDKNVINKNVIDKNVINKNISSKNKKAKKYISTNNASVNNASTNDVSKNGSSKSAVSKSDSKNSGSKNSE